MLFSISFTFVYDKSDNSGQQTSTTSQSGQQNTSSSQTQVSGGQQQQPTGQQQGGQQQPTGQRQGGQQQPTGQPQGGQQQPSGQQLGGQQQPGGQQQFNTIQQLVPQQQKAVFQKLDDDVRRLLQYYRIDDGDIVEIDDGPIHRVVLVHPERPLPAYIQQNKQLLQQLQSRIYTYYSRNTLNTFLLHT